MKIKKMLLISKVLLHQILWFWVVWPNEPIQAPDKRSKIFSVFYITQRDNFSYIPHILRICTDFFRVFPGYLQIHSAHSQYSNRIIPRSGYTQRNPVRRFTVIHIFSLYVKIHSAHSQYMYSANRFISRILSMHTDSFCVSGECTQKMLDIQNGIIFVTAFKGTLLQKTV